MYAVKIYDTSNKCFRTYLHINTIRYFSDLYMDDWESVSGEEILTFNFPALCSYNFLSDSANYKIDKSIIGVIEIEKES